MSDVAPWKVIFLLACGFNAGIGHARDRNVPAEFQRQYPCPATGKTTGACVGYVRDHVIPLACGGPDSIANMVWQTEAEGKAKDLWERQCWRWWQP